MSQTHRVYMSFARNGMKWLIKFQDGDTYIGPILWFDDDDKITEAARRGHAEATLADKQAMEHAIAHGRGGVYLRLDDEQYGSLQAARRGRI